MSGKTPPRILAVRASAGAGKTYQLTVRFLELLKGVPPSPQDLAPDRGDHLHQPGRRRDEGPGDPGPQAHRAQDRRRQAACRRDRAWPRRGRRLAQTILDHFGDFQVRTIDSLIHAVMRAFAVEMGLPPELDVDFDKDAMLEPVLRHLARLDRLGQSQGSQPRPDPGARRCLSAHRRGGRDVD